MLVLNSNNHKKLKDKAVLIQSSTGANMPPQHPSKIVLKKEGQTPLGNKHFGSVIGQSNQHPSFVSGKQHATVILKKPKTVNLTSAPDNGPDQQQPLILQRPRVS